MGVVVEGARLLTAGTIVRHKVRDPAFLGLLPRLGLDDGIYTALEMLLARSGVC